LVMKVSLDSPPVLVGQLLSLHFFREGMWMGVSGGGKSYSWTYAFLVVAVCF
jgi:hypothetical protein